MIPNVMLFIASVYLHKYVSVNVSSYIDFMLKGLLLTVLFGCIGIIVNFIANPSVFISTCEILKEKRGK